MIDDKERIKTILSNYREKKTNDKTIPKELREFLGRCLTEIREEINKLP